MNNEFSSSENLTLEDPAKAYLAETAKWTYFLSIVGFVIIALIGLGALAMLFVGSSLLGGISEGPLPVGFFTILYLLMGALYLYPTMKLYSFSKAAKAAVASNNSQQLTESLSNLKSMFKFMGIFTAIVLGIYALIFLFFMLVSAWR